MSVDAITEELSVLSLSRHIFDYKRHIDTIPNWREQLPALDLSELLREWAFLNRPLWKKARAFKCIVNELSPEACWSCIEVIKSHISLSSNGSSCRFSSSAAAFYLLPLDHLQGRLQPTEVELNAECIALVSVLHFPVASELLLPNLSSVFGKIVSSPKVDEKIVQCSLFAPESSLDQSFLTAFGKYLSDLKGLPEHFIAIVKFLRNVFTVCHANKGFVDIMDRLAKRNTLLSSRLILELVSVVAFSQEFIQLYDSVLEQLCQVDNEQVIANMLDVAVKIPVSKTLLDRLQKSYKGFNPRTKEIVSKFVALHVTGKDSSEVPDFGEFMSKELNADSTLAYLVQYSAATSSSHLDSFLAANLTHSQRLNSRTAILLGLVRAGFKSWTDKLLKDLFSASFLKDASQPSSQTTLSFYVCALVALVQSPEFECDSKLLSDTLLILSKPGSVALGCEKAWSSMDEGLLSIWIEMVVCPVMFAGSRPELLEVCNASLAWLVVNGGRMCMKSILNHAGPLCLDATQMLCQNLLKLLDSEAVKTFTGHNVWKIVKAVSSADNLKSLSLALLCHHEKLLGNGDASWPELVRTHISAIDAFCTGIIAEHQLSDILKSPYLLISILSLSPSVVHEQLQLPSQLFSVIEAVESVPSSDWTSFFTEPEAVKAKAPLPKGAKSQAPVVDNSVLKETINEKLSNLKIYLSLTCAVARALPFHPIFTAMRPEIVCKLLSVLFTMPKVYELLPTLVPSVYTIAAESFDGHGPLLVSLCLRFSRVPELIALIDPSWSIEDDSSLLSSCVETAKKMENDEFFIVCEAFSVAIPVVKDVEVLKSLVAILSEGIKSVSVAKVSVSCAKILMTLFDLAVRVPALSPAITMVVIEIGELDGLLLSAEHYSKTNLLIRASTAPIRLVALKFLVSFIASNPEIIFPSNLLNTIWLLHFKPAVQTKSVEEDEALECEDDSNSDFSYASEEVAVVASELFEMQEKHFQLPSQQDVLADILLLESEKGAEIQIANMVDSYVGALAWCILASKDISTVVSEFLRLLQSRTTPNGIVRLTKNVDRSKLDFTKQTRRSLLQALASVCKASLDTELTKAILNFAFRVGGFSDPDETNCQILFNGILDAVTNFSEALYPQLQSELTATALNDRAQVYAVIALGRAASSMSLNADRVWSLISRIQESLKVPSEAVQKAVADTLVSLLHSQADDKRVTEMLSGYVQRMRESKEDYGALRGVAFGIAAILKACGTGLIHELAIFPIWVENLGRLGQKNGDPFVCSALASIELAAIYCGVAFEPYIPPLVPAVLEALGDNRQHVRHDAEACADAMMTALSPLSVSSILPPLLEMAGADGSDPRYSWRAKLGAVTWLGSMARLAPKILTPALPRIIPALIVALTDAHEKVHLAAHHALAVKYAAIIRSPEIKAALPAILRALSDPPKYASSCLGDIIGTSFCHAVDGPSLALLEPLLTRALRERGTGAMTEAKRRAILIIANLGSLMDPVELKPYLANLVPSLRGVLGDAVPQVRAGAARALGIITRLMHSNNLKAQVLDDIVPECLGTVFSDLPSVTAIDRAGAALAVAQVASSWGLEALIKLVDERVTPSLFGEQAQKVSSASREALLHLLAALPEASPKALIPELYSRIFTSEHLMDMFEATADEDEGIREVSAKTCRALILRQALLVDLESSMDILLRAAGDGRWRVRLTAFTILSDLLPALVINEDASRCDTKSRTLSLEMRSRVLSRLYFGRFDGNSHIRNAAFSLWKSIVTHPPRVIMEILPVLVDDCVAFLCIEDEEEDEDECEDYSDVSDSEEETGQEETSVSKSLPTSQKSSQSQISYKLDKYEMATAALRDILLKLADRVLLPFTRRLSHLFIEQPKARPGILAASGILAQTAIIPSLVPPHLRATDSSALLSVQVPRPTLEEALNLILQMMQHGLTAEDVTGSVVSTSVRLLDRLEKGLVGCPNLLDKIINELLSSGSEAVVAVLCRRPQILLAALTARFKKLSSADSEIDWEWWTEVFSASGPFLAAQAAGLLAHLLKLRGDVIDSEVEGAVDALLASMSTYDPDILYGDPDLQCEDEDLDDIVDTGLFSFGQLLETLWSARLLRQLSAHIIYRFASQGKFGCERFYDIWLDRLLLGTVEEATTEDCVAALNALVSAAVENGDAVAVIENCLAAFENRSALNKNISKLPVSFITHTIKGLLLPVLADAESYSTSERFAASQYLRLLVASPGESCRLATPAITSLLGALIRCLSDRNSCTERIRAALLAIPVHLLAESSGTAAACKPFHPQLARLTVNVLKDIVAASEDSDISFDASHSRGEALLLACQLAAQLMAAMTRIDAFLEELRRFAALEEDLSGDDGDGGQQVFDEKSINNARLVLLQIFQSLSAVPVPAAAQFIDEILRGLILLPGGGNANVVEAAGACGHELVRRKFVDDGLASFINQYL